MDDIGAFGIMLLVAVLLGFGIVFISGDYREFDKIVKQCNERQYIQNNDTRIICSVEVTK